MTFEEIIFFKQRGIITLLEQFSCKIDDSVGDDIDLSVLLLADEIKRRLSCLLEVIK